MQEKSEKEQVARIVEKMALKAQVGIRLKMAKTAVNPPLSDHINTRWGAPKASPGA